MSRVQIDGANGVPIVPADIAHHHHTHAIHRASGSLGRRLSGKPPSAEPSEGKKTASGCTVLLEQADSALQRLLDASPGAAGKPTLPELMQMDPVVLSMMMAQLVFSVSGTNALSLSQQLERATEVQSVLRDKQVKEYQEQIQKAIEQADEARKEEIINTLFDWVIGDVEAIVGVMKMVEGVLTADPLELVDGAAYFAAGVSGMVKAGAETAMLLGADKNSCQSIINGASKAQLSCEGIALALDIMQIGRAVTAARAVTSATEEVLDHGLGEKLLDGAMNNLETLAQEASEAVGKKLLQDFGPAEREMVELENMASEAAEFIGKAQANMVKDMGQSFTRTGVEALVKRAVEAGSQKLLKEGGELTEEKIRAAILSKLRREILGAAINDGTIKVLVILRASTQGVEQIYSGAVALKTAAIRQMIEHLITQQNFIDFMENWTEDHKKNQQKRLQDGYLDSAAAMKSTLKTIDNYGSVLANIANGRA